MQKMFDKNKKHKSDAQEHTVPSPGFKDGKKKELDGKRLSRPAERHELIQDGLEQYESTRYRRG